MPSGRPRTLVLPIDEVRSLAEDGWSLSKLAKKYNCSIEGIRDRMIENNIPRQPRWSQPGSKNGQWRGGVATDDDGYILIHSPEHPFRTNAGYVREHRLVMELHLGQYLQPTEVVHHRDKNKANNSIENLELFASNAAHLKCELTGNIPKWTDDGLRRIREGCRRNRKKV